MPSLDGVTTWLNLKDEYQKVSPSATIVCVWAISCPICKSMMPELYKLCDAYAQQQIEIISVHAPRQAEDLNMYKVREAVHALGIVGPCAVDNDHTLADRFELSGMWPYYFLFDVDKKLKRRGAGVLGLKAIASAIKELQLPYSDG